MADIARRKPADLERERRQVPAEVPLRGGKGQVADLDESCITWHKSAASNSGGCVEMAIAGGSVLIRDSQNPDAPVLRVSAAAWPVFLTSAREETFDSRRE